VSRRRILRDAFETGGKPATLARDLGYLKRIKETFGADRRPTEITQAEVA